MKENSDRKGFHNLESSLIRRESYLSQILRSKMKEEIIYNFNESKEKDIIQMKNSFDKIFLSKIISTNFKSIQIQPTGLNLTLGDSAEITADNIGEFALPIVEYIHQTQPDYVIASDRGARLLGLAAFRLYNRLYGGFPTADGTLKFRRFSKENTQQETEQHLQPLVDEMLQYKKKPSVLVLDDWVVTGGTKKLAQKVFDKLSGGKIETKFGVLVGGKADVSGGNQYDSGFARVTSWRDDENIIGVRYGSKYDNHAKTIDGTKDGTKARPVRSLQARDFRERMYEGIDKLVRESIEAVLV